jgi:hypothetical protein
MHPYLDKIEQSFFLRTEEVFFFLNSRDRASLRRFQLHLAFGLEAPTRKQLLPAEKEIGND